MEQMAKVIQGQQEDRKSATPTGGGDVGHQSVGVDTVRMLAHPAVKALGLCSKELTSSERHQLELTVKSWMTTAQVVNNKSVESFEAEVAAMLSRYGAVKGGVLYTRIVRFCLGIPEPAAGGDSYTVNKERQKLRAALDSVVMSPDQRLAVSNVVVAAELPLRFRQIKAGMLVAEDPQMRELDSAAHRHLTTMLDKDGLESIAGCATFIEALCALNRAAGACRSQAGRTAIKQLVNQTPIPVPAGGVTLTNLVDAINQNVGGRMVKFEELGMSPFNAAVLKALEVVPSGGGDASGAMCVDLKQAMLENSEDPLADMDSLQAALKVVAEKWKSLSNIKLAFNEVEVAPVASAAPATAMLAHGAGQGLSRWRSPGEKAQRLQRGAPTVDKGGSDPDVAPPPVRLQEDRDSPNGDMREVAAGRQQYASGGNGSPRGGVQPRRPPYRQQREESVRGECRYWRLGRICPFDGEPGGCLFRHGPAARRTDERLAQAGEDRRGRGWPRQVGFAGYAGAGHGQHGETLAYRDAGVGNSTRAYSPVQQLVDALSPTPPVAAVMDARARALRNDKSQRVFLAGAEAPKLRWIYDTAAAKTLASSDIKLAKTGVSDMQFIGINGDNVAAGDVGNAIVVTGVDYGDGSVVIPVDEAHTVDTLQPQTVLYSACDGYNKGSTVIICGETKTLELWLPRRDDGTRDVLPLQFENGVLQLASGPVAIVPGTVPSDEWAAPTMGISQRRVGAERLSLDSFCAPNIFMALEGEKTKKSAGKAKASVAAVPVAVLEAPQVAGQRLRSDVGQVPLRRAGDGGTAAGGGGKVRLSDFLAKYQLHAYVCDFEEAGYVWVTDLPSSERELLSDCGPILAQMRLPEWKRLIRLIGDRRHEPIPARSDVTANIQAACVAEPAQSGDSGVGVPQVMSVPEAVLAQCPICGLFGAPGAVEIHANDCLNRQEREDFNRGRGVISGELDVDMSLRDSESDEEENCSSGGGCRVHPSQHGSRPNMLCTVGVVTAAQRAVFVRQRQCGDCSGVGDVKDMVPCIGPLHRGPGALPCREAVHESCQQHGSRVTDQGWLCRVCTDSCVADALGRQMAAISVGGNELARKLGSQNLTGGVNVCRTRTADV
jgi:hypothetical protein